MQHTGCVAIGAIRAAHSRAGRGANRREPPDGRNALAQRNGGGPRARARGRPPAAHDGRKGQIRDAPFAIRTEISPLFLASSRERRGRCISLVKMPLEPVVGVASAEPASLAPSAPPAVIPAKEIQEVDMAAQLSDLANLSTLSTLRCVSGSCCYCRMR